MEKILAAYATKYGATQEIAEKIGEILRQAGLQTEVVPVDQVRDLTPFKAVILGSAVYIGKWRKEAVQFLKKHQQALSERPVWLFSSGPTGEGDPVELMKGWRLPAELQPLVDQIKPRDIAVFHGSLEAEKMSFLDKWMIKNAKAPVGDFRDWDAITAWASTIVSALQKADQA
jgi:menaquinone-dependent protoporphyrinogen oxidase